MCYVVNLGTMMNFSSDVICHEICNHEILFQINQINQIIQNNQIDQFKLAHHRTDFGLVLDVSITIPDRFFLFTEAVMINTAFGSKGKCKI